MHNQILATKEVLFLSDCFIFIYLSVLALKAYILLICWLKASKSSLDGDWIKHA